MFKEVGEMLGDLQIENDKLKQTLADIRDIATSHQFPVCEYDGFWILQGVKKRILQKISECEGNDGL